MLVPRGGRSELVGDQISVAVTRDGTEPENDCSLIDEGLQRISAQVGDRMHGWANNDPVLDLLTGLIDAANRSPRSTIVAVSSGLQTTGLADLAGLGWDFSNADVIDTLRQKGFLPDLAGKKVLSWGSATPPARRSRFCPRPCRPR